MSPALSVPEGYKLTEVGVIPGDWTVHTIRYLINNGSITDHLDGNHGELYPKSSEFTESGIPYVTANDLHGYKVSFDNCKFLSEKRARQFRKGIAKNGDVLFAHNATVGPTGFLSTNHEFVILSTTVTYFRCNPDKVVNKYFLYAIQSSTFVRQYQSVMSQSTRNQVPITAQRKLHVILPSTLEEQQAIAEALSDADALVESLEQLLAKKRQIKQGAMQELLAGEKRLPGFSGEWVVKTFGELFHFSGGFTASRDQLSANGYCYLHYGDIHTSSKTYVDVRAEYQEIPKLDIALKKITQTSLLEDGDVVFVDASEDDDGTSKHVVVCNQDNGIPFISGLHTIVAKSKTGELANLYKRHCFQTLSIKTQFRFFAVGTKVSGISKSNIAKIVMPVPSIEEQTAIAAILCDLDSDIAALQSQLVKARQIKQGMAQALLTGRIRLVSPAITQGVPA